MSRKSPKRINTGIDLLSLIYSWPPTETDNQAQLKGQRPNLFQDFCTKPIVLPVWLWNLLIISLLVILGGGVLYLILSVLLIVILFIIS